MNPVRQTIVCFVVMIACAFVGGFVIGNNVTHDSRANGSCVSPCVVSFGDNMEEDQFCIDYRGDGTLYVWRDNDTRC